MNFFDPAQAAQLDQSKAAEVKPPQNDNELRMISVGLALRAHAHPSGEPDDVIETARDIYLFLIGEDPVVDGLNDEPAADGTPSAEVIPFRVAIRDFQDGE